MRFTTGHARDSLAGCCTDAAGSFLGEPDGRCAGDAGWRKNRNTNSLCEGSEGLTPAPKGQYGQSRVQYERGRKGLEGIPCAIRDLEPEAKEGSLSRVKIRLSWGPWDVWGWRKVLGTGMGDEEQRRVERDARYNENLAAFLVCMRDGHVPARDGSFRVEWTGSHSARAIGCGRCKLVYWENGP